MINKIVNLIMYLIFVFVASLIYLIKNNNQKIKNNKLDKSFYYIDHSDEKVKYIELKNQSNEKKYITENDLKSIRNADLNDLLYKEMNGELNLIFINSLSEEFNLSSSNKLSLYEDLKKASNTLMIQELSIDDILKMKRKKFFEVLKPYIKNENITHSSQNIQKFNGKYIPHQDVCEENLKIEKNNSEEKVQNKSNDDLLKGFIMTEILAPPISQRRK